MVSTPRTADPVVASLYDHVLTPLSIAEHVVEAEREEVEEERAAFDRFKQRVTGIGTVSTTHGGGSRMSLAYPGERDPRSADRLRTAFRETVMGVNHYDEMYGEPLDEHAARELSPDIAAVLQTGTATAFTELNKTVLTRAIDGAIDQRGEFCDQLDTELRSIREGRAELVEILDTCDETTSRVDDRSAFEHRFDEIARARQETIQQRNPSLRADRHDLCQYLYQDNEWTYPVLTAVTRFRNALV